VGESIESAAAPTLTVSREACFALSRRFAATRGMRRPSQKFERRFQAPHWVDCPFCWFLLVEGCDCDIGNYSTSRVSARLPRKAIPA
jgi:hypothetical protein